MTGSTGNHIAMISRYGGIRIVNTSALRSGNSFKGVGMGTTNQGSTSNPKERRSPKLLDDLSVKAWSAVEASYTTGRRKSSYEPRTKPGKKIRAVKEYEHS